MAQTLPCGIGAVLVVQKELAQHVLQDIQRQQEAWLIGRVVAPCHTGEQVSHGTEETPCWKVCVVHTTLLLFH